MLYIKSRLNDQVEIKIDICEDEIFTSCAGCAKELEVTEKDLIDILHSDDMDFKGTSWFCPDCTKKRGLLGDDRP